MKQTKLLGYAPKYPKKLIRGAVLTAATVVALGANAGCRVIGGEPQLDGAIAIDDPKPTEELVLDGEVAIDTPTDEVELDGYVAPETTPDPDAEANLRGDEPALQGKILVPEETEQP